MKHVEEKTESRITTKKAYSSIRDNRSRWPKCNMKDITENALNDGRNDDNYEYIVLSAPTVDITNLNTSNFQPSDSTEYLKDEVKTSCKNMINMAENLLKRKPDIKKVMILEHPPRFDAQNNDPLSLKPELAKYANSLYHQLWLSSNQKHKIVIGNKQS